MPGAFYALKRETCNGGEFRSKRRGGSREELGSMKYLIGKRPLRCERRSGRWRNMGVGYQYT